MSLIDDFENAYQACLAPITNPVSSHVLDSDELKANLDNNIQRFIDISQQIESFFIRKRAIICDQEPESILADDINELKIEIARKDLLLNHYYDKLNMWSNMVNEILAGRHPNIKMEGQNTQMMPGMGMGQMRMGPSNMIPPQMNPNHMAHVSSPIMRQQSGGMMVNPGVPMNQHPGAVFSPMNNSMQPPPGQNPLVYLERTTAHIGMNDNRRPQI